MTFSDRDAARNAGGIRLGAGIYTSHTSSKSALFLHFPKNPIRVVVLIRNFRADQYAQNIHDPSSRVKAMLVCRVVIGKPYVMYHEDHTIRSPPLGHDCVGRLPLPLPASFPLYFPRAYYAVYVGVWKTGMAERLCRRRVCGL